MNRSLENHVDNLSGINEQECKKCKERKNEAVKCKYIKYENKIIYKCDKYKKHIIQIN